VVAGRYNWFAALSMRKRKKDNEYETRLLQCLLHFTLKVTSKGEYFSNDCMKGKLTFMAF
jgi:hypothetical protein